MKLCDFLFLMAPSSPLYITVGPPCSGKTTWLRENKIQDIAIDDQPNVYHPLPWTFFAFDHCVDKDNLLDHTIAGKTVRDRLHDQEQQELRTVCAAFTGKVNPQRLQVELEEQFAKDPRRKDKLALAAVIAFAASNLPKTSQPFPKTVDLFCSEALFSPTGDDPPLTAIERAYRKLEAVPTTQPVAWGNTNLRIDSDYKRALEMAYAQHRPVHFVVFDTATQICVLNPTSIRYNKHDVDFCLDELMTRNLKRLITTGRYIPVTVLNDMLKRYVDIIRRGDLLRAFLGPSRFVRDPRTGLLEPKNKRK